MTSRETNQSYIGRACIEMIERLEQVIEQG